MYKKRVIWFLVVVIFASNSFAQKNSSASVKRISIDELRDKIAGAWIGQMIGNIYGLPHENKYVKDPGAEKWPYGYTKNLDKLQRYKGAFSDDDTDLEYMYMLQMEKYGVSPSYEELKKAWLYHIRDRVWLANRGALGLMKFGYTPPFTGDRNINPHWYQIDPQLINEIWAYTAPGMIDYAAKKSDWAARITSDSWGVEPTIHYGAMYAAAFFEKDVVKLINIGTKALPENSRYAATVTKMMDLYKKYPNDWKAARQELADEYYVHEPDMTKTIWNANLNGACGILAMLYGKGNFQHTLDLSCAMGFDADNQAATVAGLLGVVYGLKGLPKDLYLPIEGWTKPFNDRYINITRYDLPDASIDSIINRTLALAIQLVKENGGKVAGAKGKETLTINTAATFEVPLEFYTGPTPSMEVHKPVDFSFYSDANKNYKWTFVGGQLPNGVVFDKGHLSGTPTAPGKYKVKVQVENGGKKLDKEFDLLVRNVNLSSIADSIIANVKVMNESVLDSCWYTFGKSMYAKNVEVIRDGKTNGPGSVFYSLAAASKLPKVDYYGYHWAVSQNMDMIAFSTGGMEEFGGWFTSLNVQYMNEVGQWVPVENTSMSPSLPDTDFLIYQPHFVEYLISFKPVKTTAIRIIGDAKIQDHWHAFTKKVSGFTSITELSVYKSTK